MNKVYETKQIYNEKIKEDFLSTYPESSRRVYRRIFLNSAPIEEMLSKDLYEFNRDNEGLEIAQVLYSMNPITFSASQGNGRVISSYINWAIENGYRKSTNPLKAIRPEWFNKFVDKEIDLFVNEKQIIALTDYCMNAQDAVIFQLLWEGVEGRELIELTNLKKGDFDPENKILILYGKIDRKSDSQRVISVSQRTICLIQEAIEQEVYWKKNGEADLRDNQLEYHQLIENDFVLRSSITRTVHTEQMNKHTIYRRINTIRDSIGLPHLTAKNIFRSGMIHEGMKLKRKYGELGKEQYIEIQNKYNVPTWYTLKEFINEENIQKLYG